MNYGQLYKGMLWYFFQKYLDEHYPEVSDKIYSYLLWVILIIGTALIVLFSLMVGSFKFFVGVQSLFTLVWLPLYYLSR